MIHLDTNALFALPLWARDGHPLIDRVLEGETVAVSALVWYEFLIGPVQDDEVRLARAFIRDAIVAVGVEDAELAAELSNRAGRRRTLKTDALIAASAIRADAAFCTVNRQDFEPFEAYGLRFIRD